MPLDFCEFHKLSWIHEILFVNGSAAAGNRCLETFMHVISNKSDGVFFKLESCIHGYHVYQNNCLATHGEIWEMHNRSDPLSVAVQKNREVVRHVPGHALLMCVFQNDGVIISCHCNVDSTDDVYCSYLLKIFNYMHEFMKF